LDFGFWPGVWSCTNADAASVFDCAIVGLIRPASTSEAKVETLEDVWRGGGFEGVLAMAILLDIKG